MNKTPKNNNQTALGDYTANKSDHPVEGSMSVGDGLTPLFTAMEEAPIATSTTSNTNSTPAIDAPAVLFSSRIDTDDAVFAHTDSDNVEARVAAAADPLLHLMPTSGIPYTPVLPVCSFGFVVQSSRDSTYRSIASRINGQISVWAKTCGKEE
jgi:hypothetical protein